VSMRHNRAPHIVSMRQIVARHIVAPCLWPSGPPTLKKQLAIRVQVVLVTYGPTLP